MLFTKDVSNFQHDSNRSWKFEIVDIQSFSSIFLNRDYDSSIREQKLSKMYARIRAQSHFIPAILLFGRRETVSRGRVSRSLFNLLACGRGREGGRPRNARKEGSVLLHRGERGGARGASSLHIPQGKLLTVSEGNDVVNTTSVAHPLVSFRRP